MPDATRYPFVPRSNRFLVAGQYWAIPLSNERFACGRVMAVPAFGPRDRVGVVVGLIDWTGDRPPRSDQLAGRAILEQGQSRFEAITNTGGRVLGVRPLALDGLAPIEFGGTYVGAVDHVWGWRVILDLAEQYFRP